MDEEAAAKNRSADTEDDDVQVIGEFLRRSDKEKTAEADNRVSVIPKTAFDETDDPEGWLSMIGKSDVKRDFGVMKNEKATQKDIAQRLENVLLDDDPVQIFNSVVDDSDQPGTSTATSTRKDDGMRNVLLAMQASISDQFAGTAAQRPQVIVSGPQRQAAAGTGAAQQRLHRPAVSSPNILQINVNLQPGGPYGFRLRPPADYEDDDMVKIDDIDESE